MESREIYDTSYEELKRIRKELSTSNININVDKLDQITKEELLLAMKTVVIKRCSDVESVVLGAR